MQAEGRWPCFNTQSECSKQSFSAAKRASHEEAIGTEGVEVDGKRKSAAQYISHATE